MKEYSLFDHALLRIKDFIIIGGAAYAIFVWVFAFASIPKRVEANEKEISITKDYRIQNDLKMLQIQNDITAISNTVKDIKESQKEIVNLLRRNDLRST